MPRNNGPEQQLVDPAIVHIQHLDLEAAQLKDFTFLRQSRQVMQHQTDLDELGDELGEDFGEHESFHTVAGLVLHHLSRLPQEGEILQLGRFEVEVLDMDDRRIDKLLYRAIIPGQESGPTDTN